MNIFKFKFNKVTKVLLAVVLVLSLCGAGWNIFNIVEYSAIGSNKIIGFSVSLFVSVLLVAFSLALIFNGKYKITNGKLIAVFGFFPSKTELSDISEIVLYKKSDALVIYRLNGNYSVILIKSEYYQDFCKALKDQNPKIVYTEKNAEKNN